MHVTPSSHHFSLSSIQELGSMASQNTQRIVQNAVQSEGGKGLLKLAGAAVLGKSLVNSIKNEALVISLCIQ